MTKSRRWSRGCALLLALTLVPVAVAQDPVVPEPPTEEEEEPVVPEEPVPVPEAEAPKTGTPFALYVGFAAGTGSSDEIDSSIFASELDAGLSKFTLDEQLYGKASVGWKLPHGKGDFRFNFQGVKEDQYEFQSQGVSARMPSGQADLDSGLVPWWFIEVTGGQLTSTRLIPTWDLAADTTFGDGDGVADFGPCTDLGNSLTRCGEITYDAANPDRVVTGTLPDDFQNRINSYDIVYGREFGGRRYSSRWWAGLRYFEYEGQVLATAWLNTGSGAGGGQSGAPGEHFTDGGFLPLLQLAQETTGLGPVGSWEVDFNFFDRGLQFFIRGEAAFTLNSLSLDSRPFFQVTDEGASTAAVLLEDRLVKDLDKSSWQDRLELGARVYVKNGLQFEVAVARSGYLDFVLLPNLLQTGVTNEDPQTTSHDIVLDSVHAGVGFQF